MKVVLLTPKWLQRLKGCRRPAIEVIRVKNGGRKREGGEERIREKERDG